MNFDPSQLIDRLPPLDSATAAPQRAAFCAYYGLPDQQPGVAQQLGHLAVDGERIAVHRWVPDTAEGTLLIVHGYLDHHGLYGHLIRYALARNLAVVGFDLPGHGLSSGERAVIDNFDQYQAALKRVLAQIDAWQLPRPLHLLGQSTGAAILNQYLLTEKPSGLGTLILLAPLVRAANWRMVDITHRLIGSLTPSVPRRFSVNSNDSDFVAFLRRDPLQAQAISARWIGALKQWIPRFMALPPSNLAPLVVQGENDDTVDWQHNLDILRDKFPAMHTLMLTEARHQLANETAAIRQHYLGWIEQHWPRNDAEDH